MSVAQAVADAAEAQVFVTEVRIVPAGAELGDRDDADFGLKVSWRGQFAGRSGGGWSVDHRGVSLSRAGNWAWPSRFQRWQYRWETREEAVAAALAAVDGVQVNGRTRAEWAAHWARAEAEALRAHEAGTCHLSEWSCSHCETAAERMAP